MNPKDHIQTMRIEFGDNYTEYSDYSSDVYEDECCLQSFIPEGEVRMYSSPLP